MQTNTTRDKTIDFIKGILILFVILGHTTLGLTDMYSFDDTMNGIANVIYSFHMPCFIAVSGFLYSEYVGNASQGIFSRIGHKAFNILLPYVMISVIYWIIKFALSNLIREPVAVSSLISIPWKPIEFLWYLCSVIRQAHCKKRRWLYSFHSRIASSFTRYKGRISSIPGKLVL